MSGEGQFRTDQLAVPRDFGLTRLWAIEEDHFRLDENSQSKININRVKRQWRAAIDQPERPVYLEKTPTNAARIRWLNKHFPNSYFVGIHRDGYAVSEGIRRKAGHPVNLGAKQWSRSNEIMLEDLEHVEHQILYRYETLVESVREHLDDIWRFIGLDPTVVSDADIERAWGQPLSSVNNKNQRSYDSLSASDISDIEEEAGSVLEQLDYSRPTPGA